MLDYAALPSMRTAPPSWPMLLRPLSMSMNVLLPVQYNSRLLAIVGMLLAPCASQRQGSYIEACRCNFQRARAANYSWHL